MTYTCGSAHIYIPICDTCVLYMWMKTSVHISTLYCNLSCVKRSLNDVFYDVTVTNHCDGFVILV